MEADIPIPSVKKAAAAATAAAAAGAKKNVYKPQASNATAAASAAAATPAVKDGSGSILDDGAVVKPKQSKSRNGCLTCKKKRLKCDETKPLCQQCAKRNVACEGYRKDYKWRSFEDTTFNAGRASAKTKHPTKPVATAGQDDDPVVGRRSRPGGSLLASTELHVPTVVSLPPAKKKHTHSHSNRLSPGLDLAFASATHALKSELGEKTSDKFEPSSGNFYDGLDPYSLPGTATTASIDDSSAQSAGSTFSSISPRLPNLCLPGVPPDLAEPQRHRGGDDDNYDQEDFDDAVIRDASFMGRMQSPIAAAVIATASDKRDSAWRRSSPSPPGSETSSHTSTRSSLTILAEPKLNAASAEMLALRFDKHTCGILSIKDGPQENPWRNLIWPLAHESQALYHALNSMIAFHGSADIPALRVEGMRQFTKSIKNLSLELEHMRTDAALATALSLAFSEGWDHHTTTGIQHLKGAKTMVNNAVVKHCRDQQLGDLTPHDALRLKFLCNTYVYMDVIARLSSLDKASDFNLAELVAAFNPVMPNLLVDVDPLLGCAVDLFPIIGRVASLIHSVRQTPTNSLQMIGEASELKDQLHHWEMPRMEMFDAPDDPTTRVQHAMLTAESYRYAALLYLHQAVPEMACDSSSVLAKQVLLQLTNVPIWSRCVILQIFPLLAAGCEVESDEDRAWVLQRWQSMIHRLKIGNVDRCLDVIREAWSRRDAYEADKQEQLLRRRNLARSMADVPRTLAIQTHRASMTTSMLDDGDDCAAVAAAAADSRLASFDDTAVSNSRPMKRRRVTIDNGTHSSLDASIAQLSRRRGGSTIGDPTIDRIEAPYTVRGRLHWLGIMGERGWEVFLG